MVPGRPILVKILFVCTGNICRSPLAEGLMRALADEAGHGAAVQVDSAGTHDYEVGDPPDPRSVAAGRRRGIEISDQRARQVHPTDFEIFDLIIALDRGHRTILRTRAPLRARAKIHLLMDFSPRDPPDVPDPFYGKADEFDPVRDQIERGVRGLLAFLLKEGLLAPTPDAKPDGRV